MPNRFLSLRARGGRLIEMYMKGCQNDIWQKIRHKFYWTYQNIYHGLTWVMIHSHFCCTAILKFETFKHFFNISLFQFVVYLKRNLLDFPFIRALDFWWVEWVENCALSDSTPLDDNIQFLKGNFGAFVWTLNSVNVLKEQFEMSGTSNFPNISHKWSASHQQYSLPIAIINHKQL